jgi:hypothetical protein
MHVKVKGVPSRFTSHEDALRFLAEIKDPAGYLQSLLDDERDAVEDSRAAAAAAAGGSGPAGKAPEVPVDNSRPTPAHPGM